MTQLNHTFGTDPEAFIFTDFIEQDNLLIPNIVPPAALVADFNCEYEQIADKNVLFKGDNYQWSEDGAAIELQMAPTNNSKEFISRLNKANLHLTKFARNLGLKAVTGTPLGYFDLNKYWKGRDESFRQCVIFGCDPDIFPDIYLDMKLDKRSEEIDASKHSYRYGGGHIHIQCPEDNPTVYLDNWAVVSIVFDFMVGIENAIFSRNEATNKMELARLKYYGRPGRVRLQAYDEENKIYGIEYRVLSNMWIKYPPLTQRLLKVMDIAADLIDGGLGEMFVDKFMSEIPNMYEIILTLDNNKAKELHKKIFGWLFENDIITSDMLRTEGHITYD